VKDLNANAYDRMVNDYNFYRSPILWFDGGYEVHRGASSIPDAKATYETAIVNCGNRTVPDIDAAITVLWTGDAVLDISLSVTNNEASSYFGHVRVFVNEIVSTMGWNDFNGEPYTNAFLDFAVDEPVAIAGGGTWSTSVVWDGYLHDDGYGNHFGTITPGNVKVVAAVYNSEWHQGYSNPPSGNPFDAYYVDEAVGDVPSIVVDNTDAECIVISGWWNSINHQNAWGGSSFWTHGGSGSHLIGFRVDQIVQTQGTYEVFVHKFEHPYMSMMATNALHKVYHRTGTSYWIPVDLSTPGNEWISLGVYDFDSSATQGVLVSNIGNGVVTADAVKLVPM